MQAAPKDSTFGPQQLDGTSDADDGAAVVHVDGGARETFGSPGTSIMLPEIGTTNPPPAESEALVTVSVP